jgi:hypothetical protein
VIISSRIHTKFFVCIDGNWQGLTAPAIYSAVSVFQTHYNRKNILLGNDLSPTDCYQNEAKSLTIMHIELARNVPIAYQKKAT